MKKILSGQALHNFELWESDKSLSWENVMEKLKAYARGKKLDKEACRDKQAVGLGRAQEEKNKEEQIQNWTEQFGGEESGQLNAANNKCWICNKKFAWSNFGWTPNPCRYC